MVEIRVGKFSTRLNIKPSQRVYKEYQEIHLCSLYAIYVECELSAKLKDDDYVLTVPYNTIRNLKHQKRTQHEKAGTNSNAVSTQYRLN